jgi:hypothetical protein
MTPNKYKLLKKRSKDLSKRLRDLSWRNNQLAYFREHLIKSSVTFDNYKIVIQGW